MCDWKFQPGRIVVTRAAVHVLLPADMFGALARHLHGDWGDVDEEDWRANEVGLAGGERLLSVYHTSTGNKFWIITEWDRSLTNVELNICQRTVRLGDHVELLFS